MSAFRPVSVTVLAGTGILLSSLLISCGGGGGTGDTAGTAPPPQTPQECTGQCAGPATFLGIGDVQTVIAQAVAEAQARNQPATIAVADRVGNILAVFKMNGAPDTVTITSGLMVEGGLEGIAVIPSELSAIAKAITGAYLTSEGNAFSSRTASQIIQEHFNPLEFGQPAGPLFGVQFSQFACSDLITEFTPGDLTGPNQSPLGLSADPGGLPLFENGTPIGGLGIESDGLYTLDLNLADVDSDPDEIIAVAGTFNYAAPIDRRADRITLDGKTLRFSDATTADLVSNPDNAPAFATIDGVAGSLLAVTGYNNGAIIAGSAFGQPASGVRPDSLDYPGLDAFVLVDNTNVERFRPIAGTEGAGALTRDEVRIIMQQALEVANRARAQIRRPTGSQARVTISIVDSNGVTLAVARTRDAPMFGTDVSLQKARTAAFFSNAAAADDLSAAPNTIYLNPDASPSGVEIVIRDYVTSVRNFLGDPNALSDGAFAFSDRAGGNLSRPWYPDGVVGTENGPFGKPFMSWSPFTVGLQLDLVLNHVVEHLVHVITGGGAADTANNCTEIGRLANGIQIFPGSVPIYRGNQLVGGIGVSGDGVDQDDMISFLGLHEAGIITGSVNNAPPEIRADKLTPMGVRLRFIQCPQAPFLNSDEQNVCAGK